MQGRGDEFLIIGAGAAGLAIAYQLAKRGRLVRVIDAKAPGAGAMGASGGMLSPAYEAEYEEVPLLRAMIESRQRYERWAAELGDIGYERSGTYELALLPEDVPYVERRAAFAAQQGVQIEWLMGAELRRHLPILSPRLSAGSFAPEEGHVDPLLLLSRLTEACVRYGVEMMYPLPALCPEEAHGRPAVETPQGLLEADVLIVSTGVPMEGFPLPFVVHPVRGQMVSVEPPRPGWLPAPVRYFNRQYGYGYAIPKRDRILLGGTAEEKGADPSLTVGGLLEILRRAYHIFPDLYESRVIRMWAGLRPATKDRMPLLMDRSWGTTGRLVFVNGLFRNGILLLPLIGEAVSAWLLGEALHPLLQPFYQPLAEA